LDPTQDLVYQEVISTEIFRANNLSILEAIVRYLKDIKKYNFHEIGQLLQRDERNIWTIYHRAKKKQEKFSHGSNIEIYDVLIPLSIFHNKKLCVLEALSHFLKDIKNLTYHQIGLLLGRDERNIWTVYHRAKKKLENESENK